MKIAVLADLHGNMVATEAMERELDRIRPDEVWFLGDAVGKGPESDRTIDWVRTHCLDFEWGIVLKETNKVIGMIEVFDIQNARMGKQFIS